MNGKKVKYEWQYLIFIINEWQNIEKIKNDWQKVKHEQKKVKHDCVYWALSDEKIIISVYNEVYIQYLINILLKRVV